MKKRVIAVLLALGILTTSASALTVEQAREILREYYIDEIPDEVLAQDTIDGILTALGDRYTEYFTAQELAEFYGSIEDVQLVGIGIRAYYREQGVLITLAAPGSPAAEGGLQAGDWIIGIDGHDTRGADDTDVDFWIRGEEGTQVRLTVLRGEEIFEVTLTRRKVVFPNTLLEKIEDRIGWISCTSFGSGTYAQFYDIITTYDSRVDGWVVDLRGNSGGNALTAVLSAGCFGGWNSGVYMRDGKNQYYSYLSTPKLAFNIGGADIDLDAFDENGYLTADAVCVLTDEDTASAAELFCASVRDSGAGVIVGTQTYGKGVAQTLLTDDSFADGYFEDGDGFKVTSERCFSKAGATYDQVGVLPHVPVDGELADEVAALLMAAYTEGEDALYLYDVCRTSNVAENFVIPLELLCDPANSAIVEQLLGALMSGVTCRIRQDGLLRDATPEEVAQLCAITLPEGRLSDVEDSPFEEAVTTMGLYGIVDGCGDGTFRPTQALTRAELCALFVKAMRYPAADGELPAFSDVAGDSWYAPYVGAMFRLGLVEGYEDGTFRPGDPVSHEEFLVLLGRVAKWLDMDYYEIMRRDGLYGDVIPSEEELAEQYGEYAPWARDAIWLCDGEYAWADMSEIAPDAETTREEAVASMYLLFCVSGLLAR